jgi:hypothetical protein
MPQKASGRLPIDCGKGAELDGFAPLKLVEQIGLRQ